MNVTITWHEPTYPRTLLGPRRVLGALATDSSGVEWKFAHERMGSIGTVYDLWYFVPDNAGVVSEPSGVWKLCRQYDFEKPTRVELEREIQSWHRAQSLRGPFWDFMCEEHDGQPQPECRVCRVVADSTRAGQVR